MHQEDPLEKEMAIHPSSPAWKIPWTEESGRATVLVGGKESDRTEHTHTHDIIYVSRDLL